MSRSGATNQFNCIRFVNITIYYICYWITTNICLCIIYLELVLPELEWGPWRSKNLLPSIKFLLYFQVLRGNTTASAQEAVSLTMSPSRWPSGSKIKWLECLREDFKWEKSWCPRDPWWTNWMSSQISESYKYEYAKFTFRSNICLTNWGPFRTSLVRLRFCSTNLS